MRWYERARCTTDGSEFGALRPRERASRASAMCSGCPVVGACARDALDRQRIDTGVVRAGVYLIERSDQSRTVRNDARAALARAAESP